MEILVPARPRTRTAAVVLGALAVAASLLTAPGPAVAAPTATDPTPGPEAAAGAGTEAAAVEVLEEARDVLSGDPQGRDATIVLHDLALAVGDLPEDRFGEADRILARPTDGPRDPLGNGYGPNADPTSTCGVVCVHWARATGDAPDLADGDGDGIPDHVETVLATLTSIHDTYVRAGYRTPVADGNRGGNAKTDIYLADIGSDGLYGYCAPDDEPTRPAAPAYCVLDDDYSRAEFPANTPLENLQVTAAHEYFHAVQYAYDIFEDGWFLESTAAWVEDELYDGVNDNRQYLRQSPLAQPSRSIDDGSGIRVYGSWIFFRYLTERSPAAQGGLPTIVRDMWRKAAGNARRTDPHSMRAVAAVLAARRMKLPRTVARFAAANRRPATAYDEGASYPVAALEGVLRVGRRDTRRTTTRIDHLSSSTVRVQRRGSMGKAWRLRVAVDLGPKATSPAAVVTVRTKAGRFQTRLVRLGRSGRGAVTVPFGSRAIRYAEVTMVNASRRFDCFQGSYFSCQGAPRDDDERARLTVSTKKATRYSR
ncbi:MXAN_6640 family putative metalloprotease [Nocardioides dongkuii]|uniref:MXAN_6640 family putative metalloprotease n=1 Tax=Nocardioides dongkuii TaxID=2760089 RepID=UPI0018786618|nr:MXAN_6640 family putative metalloprotease [Nocardioides dongkuii]